MQVDIDMGRILSAVSESDADKNRYIRNKRLIFKQMLKLDTVQNR